ncbi:MAG: ATP-dependent endonuclease, partial [Alphaproteobacteria bacterium]|nr:ATP-dependent endonuclease [Alphaproteobacteria bacterium]
LKALSLELARRKREPLNPAWTICPTGELGNKHAFVSLFAGNDLDVVAFTDVSKKDRKKLDGIRQSQIIKSGGLLKVADFVDQEEADIEDLLDSNLFVEIVNSAYELSTKHELDVAKLANADQID